LGKATFVGAPQFRARDSFVGHYSLQTPVGASFFSNLPAMKPLAADRNFPLDRSPGRGDDGQVIRVPSSFREAEVRREERFRFFERVLGLA